MKKSWWLGLLIAPLIAVMGGCIVQDQITTLTINPDGSGDLLILRSNIRSTLNDSRAESEIAEYQRSFDTQTHDDFKRINESGARLEMAMWLRKQVPMANMIRASIPDAETLEKLTTVRDVHDTIIIKPEFTVSNVQRRLTFNITVSSDQISPPKSKADRFKQFKHTRASGISEFRIAVFGGKIIEASGFNVAGDGQSALLDIDEINSLLHKGDGNIEIFIQWEVSD